MRLADSASVCWALEGYVCIHIYVHIYVCIEMIWIRYSTDFVGFLSQRDLQICLCAFLYQNCRLGLEDKQPAKDKVKKLALSARYLRSKIWSICDRLPSLPTLGLCHGAGRARANARSDPGGGDGGEAVAWATLCGTGFGFRAEGRKRGYDWDFCVRYAARVLALCPYVHIVDLFLFA